MDYTKNYHLPQWVRSDRILMEDFNEAMANIEGGIESAKSAAKQTDEELSKRVEAAQKTADAAQTEAARLPYVVESYMGTGSQGVTITVGFRPSAVVGFGNQGFENSSETLGRVFAFGELVTSDTFVLTDTGFYIRGNTSRYPKANLNGVQYQYIAFR